MKRKADVHHLVNWNWMHWLRSELSPIAGFAAASSAKIPVLAHVSHPLAQQIRRTFCSVHCHRQRGNTTKSTILCIVYYNLFATPILNTGRGTVVLRRGRKQLRLGHNTKNFCAHVQITRIVLIPIQWIAPYLYLVNLVWKTTEIFMPLARCLNPGRTSVLVILVIPPGDGWWWVAGCCSIAQRTRVGIAFFE